MTDPSVFAANSVRTDRDIQVLIVGAGIGGLVLAAYLQRAGLEPIVISREKALDTPQGPIELWPECADLLADLGIWGDLCCDGTAVTTWTHRQPDGTVLSRREANDGVGVVVVEYAKLRARLLSAFSAGTVRTGMRLRSIEERQSGVAVSFENGVREQFNVVVGADGVRSRTRAVLGGDTLDFYGTTSLTFALEADINPDATAEVWADDGAVLRILPGSGQATAWLTIPTTVPGQGWGDTIEPAELCPSIEWLLPDAVGSISRETVWWEDDFWIRADQRVAGRVALLGNAAYTCHRLSGISPMLAIEDAAVLAAELLDDDRPLTARLADYAARRQSPIDRFMPLGEPCEVLSSVDSPLADRDQSVLRIRRARIESCFGNGSPAGRIAPPNSQ